MSSENATRVGEQHLLKWAIAALSARVNHQILSTVVDPHPGSPMAEDDDGYPWEKCSAWTRQFALAAVDHLVMWANIAVPMVQPPGLVVANPPRPYYTIARAALEAASQAVWVLAPGTSHDRVHRHLRLVYHDLRQLQLAMRAAGNMAGAELARERMKAIGPRVSDTYSFGSIKDDEPSYLRTIKECAELIDRQPNELEHLWRGASAAAHGKSWFNSHGYNLVLDDEYEPGYFRTTALPDASVLTETLSAASDMTSRAVARVAASGGYDWSSLHLEAIRQQAAVMPLRPGTDRQSLLAGFDERIKPLSP